MCSNSLVLTIFKMVDSIYTLTKIALPIILIITTTMDMSKEVMGGLNYKGALTKLLYRFIAVILVFIAPIVVGVVFDLVKEDTYDNTLSCLLDVTDADIQNAYVSEAVAIIETLEEQYDGVRYNDAKNIIANIDEQNVKTLLTSRLDRVKEDYDSKHAIIKRSTTSRTTAANPSGREYMYTGGNSSNGFKYYNQCDKRYSPVGGYNTCNCGCGYVSISMIVDSLKGTNYTPVGIITDLSPATYASKNCAVLDSTFTNPILYQKYGVSSTVIFGRNNFANESETTDRKNKLVTNLGNGYKIILLVPGHYIVLGGISNGYISVYDPANSANTKNYTIDELYNKYKNHKNRCSNNVACGFVYAVGYR